MKQKKILEPTINAISWKKLLADPEKHWQDGYSAKMTAESWEAANDIPKEIVNALNNNEQFRNAELLMAIPEFKVSLPGGTRPSQNDLLVLISNEIGLTVITIEAKAKEDFGPLISDWLQDNSKGKRERLEYILKEINFKSKECLSLRYQLFHRLASAVIMAKKFHARNALMVIQSFIESDEDNHFKDFEKFVNAYDQTSTKERPIKVGKSGDVDIYVMWVHSK